MMARAWNDAVAWLWYAFGCPPRFPLRRLEPGESLLWDVCDAVTGRPRVIVPGRHAARAVAALWNRALAAYGSGRRVDYARHGVGWLRPACTYCQTAPAADRYDRCDACRTWRDEEWCDAHGHPHGMPLN